jgi:hypothetical protein
LVAALTEVRVRVGFSGSGFGTNAQYELVDSPEPGVGTRMGTSVPSGDCFNASKSTIQVYPSKLEWTCIYATKLE